MSNVIDRGIIEMNFDNSDFEKNVKTSMSTIDKLKSALKFEDAGNGLDNLSKAANKLDLSNISNSLDTISNKFSAMGIVAMTTVSEITKDILNGIKKISRSIVDMTVQGGINRAMNIEKAKFQLEGLGVAWEDISDDIDYGVKDTAYGLDSAARVASQLVASGVQIGDDMKNSLRAISGVAAMTDSTYDEIGAIFTTVAGQGKLMTMQLRQLESRGLNAAATLAEQLGVSEAAVREMVTDGEINFATFSNAMDAAFGEHAKDSNKTLTGTLSNVKSAFARIGAEFIQPLIKNEGPLVELLNAVRVQVNNLKAEIVPLAKAVSDVVTRMSAFAKSVVDNINFDGVFDTAIEKAEWLYNNIESIVKMFDSTIGMISHNFSALTKAIKEAFKEVFDGQIDIKALSNKFVVFNNKLKITEKGMQNLKNIFKLAFSVIKGGINLIKRLYSIAKNGLNVLKSTASEMFNIVGTLSGTINETKKVGSVVESVLGNIEKVIANVFDNFSDFIDSVQNGESILESALKLLENSVKDVAVTIIKSIEDVIFELTGIDVHILSDLVSKIFCYAWSKIDDFINNFKNGGGLQGAVDVFWDILKDLGNLILDKFEEVTGIDLSDFKKTISDATNEIKEKLDEILETFKPLDTIKEKFEGVNEKVAEFSETLSELGKSAGKGLGKILENPFLTLQTLWNNKTLTKAFDFITSQGRVSDFVGFRDTIDDLRTTLKAFTRSIRAQEIFLISAAIISFSIGVSILASAVGKLTGINDWETALGSIGTVITLLGGLVGSFVILAKVMSPTMKVFEKSVDTIFGKKIKGINKNVSVTSGGIISAALSLILIATALKMAVDALAEINKTIDGGDPIAIIASVVVLVVELYVLIDAFEALNTLITGLKITTKQIAKILLVSEAMKLIAESAKVMVEAFNNLNDIDSIGQMIGKLIEIFALMLGMAEFVSQMNGIGGKVFSASAGMVLFAFAIKELVEAMNALEQTDPLNLVTALGVVLLLMDKLTNSTFLIGGRKVLLQTSVAFLSLAVSIKILTSCIEKLGNMKLTDIAKGFITLELLLSSFTMVVKTLQMEMKDVIKAAGSFLLMAAAMYIVAKAIKALKDVDIDHMLVSMLTLTFVIAAFSEIAKRSKDNLKGAASILILSAALGVLALAFKMLNDCDMGKMVAQAVLLSLALYVLGAMAESVEDNILGAATLIILAGAILVLSAAFKVMSTIPWSKLLIDIGMMAGIIALLGAAAWAAGALGPEILIGAAIVAGVLAIIAVGILAISGALAVIDLVFNAIAVSAAGFAESLKMLADVILEIAKTFSENSIAMVAFGVLMVVLAGSCLTLSGAFLLLGAGAIVLGAGLVVLGAGLAIASLSLLAFAKIMEIVIEIVNGIASGIQSLNGELNETGEYVSKGLVKGLLGGSGEILNAGKFIGKVILSGFCGILGIHSPSVVMEELGNYVDEGLINGLEGGSSDVQNAASNLGSLTADSLSSSLLGGTDFSSLTDVGDLTSILGNNDISSLTDLGDLSGLLDNTELAGYDLGTSFDTGISNGIIENSSLVTNATSMLGDTSGITGSVDTSSLFSSVDTSGYNLGSLFDTSVGNGIIGNTGAVTSATNSLGTQTSSSLFSELSSISEVFNSDVAKKLGELGKALAVGGNTGALRLASGLKENLPQIKQSASELGTTVTDALSNHMQTGFHSAETAVEHSGTRLMDSSIRYGENSGKYMGSGYLKGLNGQRTNIINTATAIAKAAYIGMKAYLKINSPSKMTEELGKWTDLGFARGLVKYSSDVEDSSERVANSAVDSMTQGLITAYDNLSSDIEDPVIKPVVDMSDVQNGSSKINSMFGKDYASSISANYKSNGQLMEEANMANAGLMNALNGQLVNAINANGNSQVPVNVNVTLAGDAEGLFRVILNENTRLIKANGYSPLLR